MASEKKHKRLTIAELRNFKGFEAYSDEQAEETIKTLEKLSILFYKLHMKQRQVDENFRNRKNESKEAIKTNSKKGKKSN